MKLRQAGFSIWPFDAAALPVVVEIYPRALTKSVNKSSWQARSEYLNAWWGAVDPHLMQIAASSEDAFDAAVSALVMSTSIGELTSLPRLGKTYELEGAIWVAEAPPAEPAAPLPNYVFEGPPPEFHFEVGGYSGGHRVWLENWRLRYEFREGDELTWNVVFDPSPERWRSFMSKVDRIGVMSWQGDMGDGGAVGGTGWSLRLMTPWGYIDANGDNSFPPDGAPEPTSQFIRFCRAVSELIGAPRIF